MISALYAAILALLIAWLSMNVINKRRKHRVGIGDGENHELKIAIAAHANAVEYIPIALLLLFALEYNQGHYWLVNLCGLSLVTGRLIHARGLLTEKLKVRVLGMQITLGAIVLLAVVNLLYLPYEKLFTL